MICATGKVPEADVWWFSSHNLEVSSGLGRCSCRVCVCSVQRAGGSKPRCQIGSCCGRKWQRTKWCCHLEHVLKLSGLVPDPLALLCSAKLRLRWESGASRDRGSDYVAHGFSAAWRLRFDTVAAIYLKREIKLFPKYQTLTQHQEKIQVTAT